MNCEKLNSRGIINQGNLTRFSKVMKKAMNQVPLTIGFLGGSITQGALSSQPTTCYAYRVFEWWENKFHTNNFTYLNSGIGATTSQFGVARLDSDLLCYEPDIVLIEYSVNDDDTEKFQQTFEACIRNILSSKKEPALFMFNNVQYDTGSNAQRVHNVIGKYYDLPIVSMKESIYQAIIEGDIKASDITTDNLHPNDAGHELVAGVITNLLDIIYDKVTKNEVTFEYLLPKPYTMNCYGRTVRYNNLNSTPTTLGFQKDTAKQQHITDIFKNGWTSSVVGDCILFDFEGSMISVQYRKTIQKPAPIAIAMIDDDKEHAVILDANFTETWGDKLELQDIFVGRKEGNHTLSITIEKADGKLASNFYLAAVIY